MIMRCVAAIFLLVSPATGWSLMGGVRLAPRRVPAASAGPALSPAMSADDPDTVEGLHDVTRMEDEDRDSAMDIDTDGVVEWIEERGMDDETDEGLDAAVIIVGAGTAGIGCAVSLVHTFGLDPSRVLLLERGDGIGTSFRMWPKEMRFISPSFNQAGWTNSFDLNSPAHGSSPAFSLHAQHPSGAQYADYLEELAELAQVKQRVKRRCDVLRVSPVDGRFDVHVRTTGGDGQQREETLRSRYVVWAAGEFQYPRETSDSMAGAELCMHNSRVSSWSDLPGDDFVVIGGCVAISPISPHLRPVSTHLATYLADLARPS